ncbi:hypothetical protein EV207_1576 [Scopulibacillus darangshiensis]|uniref:Uncharacterized protein n=1 Tax=Scopulibacillus darangshiensis TaxID=442528 RepID=A0A4R2NFJ3_9BACL|nr:hypothetical protein EV207_1576 [Scopulibacillus darangshiensis]
MVNLYIEKQAAKPLLIGGDKGGCSSISAESESFNEKNE